MMLPPGPLPFAIPAKAGIHLSARKFLPDSHERLGSLLRRSLAAPWIPAFPTDQVRGLKAHGMAVVFGQVWADA
jgi:hypothetical protein